MPEDEREGSPDYVDALQAIQEEEDDRLIVEKIHRAAAIEIGRLKQAQEAEEQARSPRPRKKEPAPVALAPQSSAETDAEYKSRIEYDRQRQQFTENRKKRQAELRAEEERGFQPRQRGARGLADARRVEPEDFPRTLPADTSGINLLQQSIEGGGIEPLELSSVLSSDIVAEANRLQEEGKLSQTQEDSQAAIDIAEEKIALERLRSAIEESKSKEQALQFSLKAEKLRDELAPSSPQPTGFSPLPRGASPGYIEQLARVEDAQRELVASTPRTREARKLRAQKKDVLITEEKSEKVVNPLSTEKTPYSQANLDAEEIIKVSTSKLNRGGGDKLRKTYRWARIDAVKGTPESQQMLDYYINALITGNQDKTTKKIKKYLDRAPAPEIIVENPLLDPGPVS